MKKIVLIVVVVALFLSFIGWRLYKKMAGAEGGSAARQARSAPVAVVLQPVRRESIRDVRTFTGNVIPKAQFIAASKVAGRLDRLFVNIGQRVKNGDLVAVLDNMEYDQQVKQARAELEVANANAIDASNVLDVATREFDRVKELRKQQVASEAELDQAGARYRAALAKNEVALAQVKQMEAALKADEVRLSYTKITAAWEGGEGERVVGERYVDEGAMLRANDPILSILDIGTVIAAIFAIERDYPKVQVGQAALIDTDAFPGKTFTGKIARKAPLLRESSRQARVEIEIANPDYILAPGMFVRVEIQFASRDDATVVPVAALAQRNGQTGVFLADANASKARFVPVTLGIVDGESVEVLDPPLEGQVVTMGQHLLVDGGDIIIPADKPGTGQNAAGSGNEAKSAGGAR